MSAFFSTTVVAKVLSISNPQKPSDLPIIKVKIKIINIEKEAGISKTINGDSISEGSSFEIDLGCQTNNILT
ncbi:MAG: hypothetical protein HN576_14270 [Bacteriovoracaceae bacterium]|nr:hypothetical protein [Bacteriovoracaceae bacterium]